MLLFVAGGNCEGSPTHHAGQTSQACIMAQVPYACDQRFSLHVQGCSQISSNCDELRDYSQVSISSLMFPVFSCVISTDWYDDLLHLGKVLVSSSCWWCGNRLEEHSGMHHRQTSVLFVLDYRC